MNTKMIKSFSQLEIKSNDEDNKSNVLRRSVSEKTLLYKKTKKKKNDDDKDQKGRKTKSRFLIIINVFGSAGPIRFVVNEDEDAATVIETTLKLYSRQGRLPILGSDVNTFSLYPANAEYEAMNPWEAIGSQGVREFVLCKKQRNKAQMSEDRSHAIHPKGSSAGSWRSWLHKSLSLKILSHYASSMQY